MRRANSYSLTIPELYSSHISQGNAVYTQTFLEITQLFYFTCVFLVLIIQKEVLQVRYPTNLSYLSDT